MRRVLTILGFLLLFSLAGLSASEIANPPLRELPQTTEAYREFWLQLLQLRAAQGETQEDIAREILARVRELRVFEEVSYSSVYSLAQYSEPGEPSSLPPLDGIPWPEEDRALQRISRFVEAFNNNHDALSREEQLNEMMQRHFSEYDIPIGLRAVAFVESSFSPRVVGLETRYGRACGMWQFIPDTAKLYGLEVDLENTQNDERFDVEKSTNSAARYLRELLDHEVWRNSPYRVELALASYNWGPANVARMVHLAGPNFWNWEWSSSPGARNQTIPRETYQYVPKVYAAMAALQESGDVIPAASDEDGS